MMRKGPDIRNKSAQWHNGRFQNADPWQWMSLSEYAGMMYEYIFTGGERTPGRTLPSHPVEMDRILDRSDRQLSATWLGHSTLLINIDGIRVLTDPVFTRGITLLGPWRYNGNPPLALEAVPDVDIVIISHNHFDHLNDRTIRAIAGRVGVFVTPLGVGRNIQACGVASEKIVELDWWEQYTDPCGLSMTAAPARHFSGRGVTDRDTTLWASFVLQGRHHKAYFGGDSGYFDGFKQIGERFGPFDMTFVETGAYSKYWHAVHMFPEETVQAHLDLRGNVLHPIHWGTFNLSLHSWYEPMRRLTAAAKEQGVRCATPIVGQTTVFDTFIPDEQWWEPVIAGPRTDLDEAAGNS